MRGPARLAGSERVTKDIPVSDAAPGNWVDHWAPEATRPFLRLARADRPIGTWLLLIPCWWSSALAALADGKLVPNLWHMLLFAVGAFVMRAAGCTYNDFVDRDYDAKVERTRSRPIPSGQVSPRGAIAFMIGLALVGLLVLVQFNDFTIMLGIASLLIVAIYPFMKRFTYFPQAVLGLAFSWGALMGWAAHFGELDWPPIVLYVATVIWTIGYDTIYAHQDKEDDALLGLKSTALKFGASTPHWLAVFYGLAWAGIFAAGYMAGGRVLFGTAMALAALQLAWQVSTLEMDEPENCLKRFRSNRNLGLIVLVGLVADAALQSAIAA